MTVAAPPTEGRPAPRPQPAIATGSVRDAALVWSIVVAGGVATWFATAAPTGMPLVDGAYRASYAMVVASSCAHARRWTWPVVAGAPLLAGQSGPWAIVAAGALVAAFAGQLRSRFVERWARVLGATMGALAAQCLLRLPDLVAFGVPSLIALLAPLPAAVSALRAASPRTRRASAIVAAVAAGAAVASLALFAVGSLIVRDHARDGMREARAGLDSLRDGEQFAAAHEFRSAEAAFDRADRATAAWWMRPFEAIPVLHQHLEAARTLAHEGARISAASAEAAPAASVDELTTDDGHFRLDQIESLQPLARRVVGVLERSREELAGLGSGWLTAPTRDAIDTLRGEVDDTLTTARTTAEALELAPPLLGRDGLRTYVVLFANPAEAREMGGFVASVGLLTAQDGALEFDSLPATANLSRMLRLLGADLEVEVPPSMVEALPQAHVENWTDTPDISTIDTVAASLVPALGGRAADGVVYVDPRGLAGLLELTGPVTIPSTGTVLTAENAVDYLLRDQYGAEGFQPGDERKERLGLAGEAAFDQLLSGRIPGPRRFAEVLSPLVHGRRLLFSTSDPAPHRLLDRVGLRPAVDIGAAETVLVTHGNRRSNKLDAYLTRNLDYAARIDGAGGARSTVTVTLHNGAPLLGLVEHQLTQGRPDDPVPRTTNVLALTLYSRLTLDEVTVDGQSAGRNESAAYGLNQFTVPVSVPAGSTVQVVFELSGVLDGEGCTIGFLPNAGANDDGLRATVERPAGVVTLGPTTLDSELELPCGP